MFLRNRMLLPLAGAGILVLAACGSSGGSAPAGQAAPGGGATTVSIHSSGKGDVLSDASGRTLYFNDQEKGNVLCKTSDCTAIWLPLTVSSGQMPTGPGTVSGKLGTLKRPDGKTQVTLGNKPLYTFSFDHAPGDTGGDGFPDHFDGTDFTWHAATASGAVVSPSAPVATSPSYGYGYNR